MTLQAEYDRAVAAHRRGELGEAERLYRRLLEAAPSSAAAHHMNTDYSAYEGWQLTGKCKTVLLRGKLVIDDNKCLVERGNGEYIKRKKVTGII